MKIVRSLFEAVIIFFIAASVACAVQIGPNPTDVRLRIDPFRRAVAGYSMGGGATLVLSRQDSTLKADISMAVYGR
ncbi:MAG: hypothetical protein ABSC11_03835 [Smithella sp.]|jgi:hypothetical protein